MALSIDERLLDPYSVMEIIENFNRIMKQIDGISGGSSEQLETIKSDIQSLKTATADLPTIKSDLSTAKSNITTIQQETSKITTMESDITKLKSDLASLTERVTVLEGAGA